MAQSRPLTKRNEPEPALSAQLHGKGLLGQAFQRVCKAGFDAWRLECWLVRVLPDHPLRRAKSYFPAGRRRKLERIARSLEDAAAELGGEASNWIFVLGSMQAATESGLIGQEGCPMGPSKDEALAMVQQLRDLTKLVRGAISHLGSTKEKAASDVVGDLIDEVRSRTGKPRYEDMATLVGRAYRRPGFSAEDLKMFVRRNPPRRKK